MIVLFSYNRLCPVSFSLDLTLFSRVRLLSIVLSNVSLLVSCHAHATRSSSFFRMNTGESPFFRERALGFSSCGIPFLLLITVPQAPMFLSFNFKKKAWRRVKAVHVNLVPFVFKTLEEIKDNLF